MNGKYCWASSVLPRDGTPPDIPEGEEGLPDSGFCEFVCCMWLNCQFLFDGTKLRKKVETAKEKLKYFGITSYKV